DKGDRIRNFHLLRCLAHTAAVHLVCLADEPVPAEAMAALRRYCVRVAALPVTWSRWPRALGSLAWGGTVTEGAFSSPSVRALLPAGVGAPPSRAALASASSRVPSLRLPGLDAAPAVVDLVDVDSQKWLDYAEAGRGPKSWLYRLEG